MERRRNQDCRSTASRPTTAKRLKTARLLRTNDALHDLNIIWLHIAQHNSRAADRLIERIDHTLNLLLEYPQMGQAVDHLRKGVRRSSVGDYQLFYEPIPDGIRLLRVYHAARPLEDLFG